MENYRGYTETSLERLRFVRSAQATGLSLEDIESLLQLTRSSEPHCEQVLLLMHRRLQELRARIAELNQLEHVLAQALGGCCKGHDRDLCLEVSRMTELQSLVRK